MSEKINHTFNNYLKIKGWRLVVYPDPIVEEEVSDGGIVIAKHMGDAKKFREAAQFQGTVIAIGNMCWKGMKGYDYDSEGPWCEVGDHIMYSKYAGEFIDDPVKRDPNTGNPLRYFIINDEDVIGPLDENYSKEV